MRSLQEEDYFFMPVDLLTLVNSALNQLQELHHELQLLLIKNYYSGATKNCHSIKVKTDNFVNDVTDHFQNYLL